MREPELLYRDIAEGVQRFHGICDTLMRHGEEWSFMQLGKYVERAQLVGSMLAAHRGDAAAHEHDDGEWPVPLDDFLPRPYVILNRLDDLLDGHAEAPPGNQPLNFRDLSPIGRQFREFHDVLERSYVYYPADA